MLQKMFNDILENYSYSRKNEEFTLHYYGDLFRKHIVAEIKRYIQLRDITIKGSIGQGSWATIPWIALMNAELTETTQRGIYVVYLFAENGTDLYLTLNQGCADIVDKHGKVTARDILKRRRDKIREFLMIPEGFMLSQNLQIGNTLYEEGCIIHKKYVKGSLPPDDILISDLLKILKLYSESVQKLIEITNEILPTEAMITTNNRENHTEQSLVVEFSSWLLSKKYAVGHVPKIIAAIENISEYAKRTGASDFNILEQHNTLMLRNLIYSLQRDQYFMNRNDNNSGRMLSTLRIYLRFLIYLEKKINTETEEVDKSAQKMWETEEVILLVTVFYYNQVEYDGKHLKASAKWLSESLNKRAYVLGEVHDERYRNQKGALMKLGNINSLDSDSTMGLKNYSKMDADIFSMFHENPEKMFDMAADIISKYNLKPMESIANASASANPTIKNKRQSYIYNWVPVQNPDMMIDLTPVAFEIYGREYSINGWSQLIYKVFYILYIKCNTEMKSLDIDPLFPIAQESFFSRSNQNYQYCKKLPNGIYMELSLSAKEILNMITLVLERCNLPDDCIKICFRQEESYRLPENKCNENSSATGMSVLVLNTIKKHKGGIDLGGIQEIFPSFSKNEINGCLLTDQIIQINDRYYHKDNIYDYDTAVIIIDNTLKKLFKSNNEYASAKMLFDNCKLQLDEFLYYNGGFDSINAVYDLARHIFEKQKYEGKEYIFSERFHIWEKEPDYPKTFFGLFVKWARENNGFIDKNTIIEKLTLIGAGNPQVSFSQNMKKDNGKHFLQYEEYKYVLAEEINIDSLFLDEMKTQIERLLSNDEFISIGQISEYFYSMLPTLPFGIRWTPLLLESILTQHEEVGYVSIPAGTEYDLKTIDAAIVKKGSHYQRFSEIVWKTIDDALGTPYEMTADEFRTFLLDKGFIHGSERLFTIHSTVEGDLRFFWFDENKKVIISKE